MLTYAEVGEVVAQVTYRPGWRLETYEDPHEGLAIAIVAEVEDAYHPGQTVELDIHSYIPPMRDRQAVLDWLLWRLERIASHEVREFARFDGQLIAGPHA